MSSPYQAYGNPRPGATPYMYPPNGPPSTSAYSFNTSQTTIPGKPESVPKRISRTPSPTPSEAAELAREGVFDWKTLSSWRFWFRREWLWYYVILILLTIITALITIFHRQIVDKLTPAAHWVKGLPGGWAIPIAILFVISFPPLFGHEIIAILCGVVWGLWIGFAIVAAGTFLGELGNFYAFKYCCHARGEKLEKTNLQYACLARVVRDGGFKIALIARFSAIPGHFTTAVFATCGMSVWTFSLAAFLSLPKQLATVYLGVIIEGSGTKETTSQRIASISVIVITTIVTIVAAWYIYRKLNRAKPAVIYDRRKARQAKMELDRSFYNNNTSTVSGFNPNPSESDIPLRHYDPEHGAGFEETAHQQWDEMGRAIGYAPDPRLHAPRPRPPSFSPSTLYAPPAAAIAAVTSSTGTDSEDEWSNAHTPRTARPPDISAVPVLTRTTIPSSGPTAPVPYSPSSYAPPSSFPPPPKSLHPRRTLSPPSSATSQYATYPTEHFTMSSTTPSGVVVGTGTGALQPQSSSATGLGTTGPLRNFSPPPSYR
ncbi:snare associated Golgi protein-domain-containing protein [Multifurca ochricompacta]|uniref:Golgi apparatus membrane protein TVP38 n=1 Tax=Multifurca ochricompacta TaxID=376703 RepID=A0AAD4QJ33_9AGAM|nr:snare associated Golgi protein-domain-containing protein [Multifurca ochricompacta]